MQKFGKDPAVKKTLIRNYEKKVRKENLVTYESVSSSSKMTEKKTVPGKEFELDQPTICSSETLANYLNHTKNALPPPLSAQDLNVDKAQLSAQITKKLNFHFNDRIYKNLVELNADIASSKDKTNKRPVKMRSTPKRDLEPNIDDFCIDEKVDDIYPNIPLIKPKINRIMPIENGDLHKLVATYENL